MMGVGQRREVTREFTIYKMRSPYTKNGAYLVELDGTTVEACNSLDYAHKLIKAKAKVDGLAGAGVSEVFGRNRQFTITPRYGFKTFKGD